MKFTVMFCFLCILSFKNWKMNTLSSKSIKLRKLRNLSFWQNERREKTDISHHREKQYAHGVKFFEAATESVLQLCLGCLILREFGLSNAGYQAFNQLSGIFSSLVSIVMLFAKVGTINTTGNPLGSNDQTETTWISLIGWPHRTSKSYAFKVILNTVKSRTLTHVTFKKINFSLKVHSK